MHSSEKSEQGNGMMKKRHFLVRNVETGWSCDL